MAMGHYHSLRQRIGAFVFGIAAMAMVLALPTPTFAQAVAEGTVTEDFSQWPGGPNTVAVGGTQLECFTLNFKGQLPSIGTVYTIDDHDVTLSEFDESLVAMVIGARNHTFAEGSLLAKMAANGDLDDIIQLTIWTYTDNYDLAVATVDERAAVAELQALVDATFGVEPKSPIAAADIVFAAAPDPAVARLAVLPPKSATSTTSSPTTAPELGSAVTTVQTTVSTTAGASTSQPTSSAPTTTQPTTTKTPTTRRATTARPSTTSPTTAAPATTASTTTTASSTTTSTTVVSDATDGPEPTVLAAVQEKSPLDTGSDSSGTLWAGIGILLAGAVVALFAAKRALVPKG